MGRGFWVLLAGLGMLSGAFGCATPSATAEIDEGASSSAPRADGPRGEPERVVQRIAPAPDRAVNAGSSKPGSSKAGSSRAEGRSNEPISSKHLEAELNRLEAELGK